MYNGKPNFTDFPQVGNLSMAVVVRGVNCDQWVCRRCNQSCIFDLKRETPNLSYLDYWYMLQFTSVPLFELFSPWKLTSWLGVALEYLFWPEKWSLPMRLPSETLLMVIKPHFWGIQTCVYWDGPSVALQLELASNVCNSHHQLIKSYPRIRLEMQL